MFAAIPTEADVPKDEFDFGLQIQNFEETAGHDGRHINDPGQREINLSLSQANDTDDIDIRDVAIPLPDGTTMKFRMVCSPPVIE